MLRLKKEILTELAPEELTRIAGGAPTVPVRECVVIAEPSGMLAAVCESLLRPCVSYTCTD